MLLSSNLLFNFRVHLCLFSPLYILMLAAIDRLLVLHADKNWYGEVSKSKPMNGIAFVKTKENKLT